MICEKICLYENRKDVTLTTYVWEDSPELLNGKERPAILICPGGAYLNCSDREGEPIALAFASMGYHAFVLRYSVYTEGENNEDMFSMPGKEAKPSCIFPKPMQDIGAAMMYIRAHSKEWKVNMEQVAICGFSAGAHNCAMYSVYYDKPEIAGFFGMAAQQMRPAAVILGYTMSDYTIMLDTARQEADPIAAQLFRSSCLSYLGTEEPDEEMIRKVSPAFHVNADTPPVFLWATSADGLVPVQNSIVMAKALADAGVPFEIHIYEEGMHGLSTATEASAGNLWEINRIVAGWLPMCREWLSKRLTFQLEEKPAWADQDV